MHLNLSPANRPLFPGDPNVLMFYNEPLLFWLPNDKDLLLLAIATPSSEENQTTCANKAHTECYKFPLLVVSLSEAMASAMLLNQVTVREVFIHAAQHWFVRDYMAETLELHPIYTIPETWLPGAGCCL